MFSWSGKSVSRRESIRKDRPDTVIRKWEKLRSSGIFVSLQIAAVFWVIATAILMLRQDVVPYRPGQWVHHDIISRVTFVYMDKQKLADAQRLARQNEPHVYTQQTDAWKDLEEKLIALPDRVAAANTLGEMGADLRGVLDSGSFTKLKEYHAGKLREDYQKQVKSYIASLRQLDQGKPEKALIILPDKDRIQELDSANAIAVRAVESNGAGIGARLPADLTLSPSMTSDIETRVGARANEFFELALQTKVVALTMANLKPSYLLDDRSTADAQNHAADVIAQTLAQVEYKKNQPLVPKGEIDDRYWQLLKAENSAFIQSLDKDRIKQTAGLAGFTLIVTVVLGVYVSKYQPKIIRKHARGVAIVALLFSMLLMAQLAGIGTSPMFIFGIAPTVLVAMILTIAYDQRFAMGIATVHAVLVAIALGQGLGFFVILFAGVMTCCYLLDDIRTRSKLVEVGGATGVAMMAACAAAGLIGMDPLPFIGKNCLYTGAAGIAVGFVVLGILPFIEKSFRITTSMTLLELADVNHPLLRRLSTEAPGTYNHSLQVATIAEACAETIKANALLCRVASYYHDVGKINKADYFCENQTDGINRHINLSPSVSLLIIIGHVKDGVALASEYNLPTSIFPFIQQHHGTTLVEFFYHQARAQQEHDAPDQPAISEVQYRYPGPRPRTKEIAIVMIADACESATRAMREPDSGRIESLVHDIVQRRLLDGQFDECDLSMREIQQVERQAVKSLLAIYHGRIAYPSTSQQQASPAMSSSETIVRSA